MKAISLKLVTRHVTTWKHAPFSRAPRVCLRLGVLQNQAWLNRG